MAITQISSLGDIIQTIVGETIYTQRQKVVMRQLVRTLVWPDGKGHPLDLPKLGKLTANALVEGVDMNNPETLTDTKVTITPTNVGLQVFLTDRMLNRAPPGFGKMVAEEMARAYGEKMDKDLLGLFSGFANGLSASTAALNVGNLGAGRARIKGNTTEAAPEPIHCVLHPYHLWDIHSSLLPLASGVMAAGATDEISAEVLRAKMGHAFAMDIWEAGNIGGTPTTTYSAIFSKEGLLLVIVDEGRARSQRDESALGDEVNFVGEYGYGERTDVFGYFLLADATAPTV